MAKKRGAHSHPNGEIGSSSAADPFIYNASRIEKRSRKKKKDRATASDPPVRTAPCPDKLEDPPTNWRNIIPSERGSNHDSRSGSTSFNNEDVNFDENAEEVRVERRGRGVSKNDKYIRDDGFRWVVEWNNQGCAVGQVGHKLNRRIASIARMGNYWPIDRNWRDMKPQIFFTTWKMIAVHYDLNGHQNAWSYIFKRLQARWLGWRGDLHAIYLKYDNDEQRLQNIPLRVDREQWANLVRYWGTERFHA